MLEKAAGPDSLVGFEIGISGAVPERSKWSEPALDRAILEFVSVFSALVIKYGGRIIHGSHPTFTPVIVEQARNLGHGSSQKPVTLFISELWADTPENQEFCHYLDVSDIFVTKRIGSGNPEDFETRNNSLTLMRRHLVQSMNTIVTIGGLFHEDNKIKPGVLEEIELATSRGIPCFLLGGMGGMTARLARNSEWLTKVSNGLPDEQNRELLATNDIASCVSIILDHLIRNQGLAKRELLNLKISPGDCIDFGSFICSPKK
ncbi:MAG: hypothetical protein ACLQBD_16855 [Syntrophobacteraceae bacterium]